MEQHVWLDERVLKILKEVVLISLYVEDKGTLPERDQVESRLKPGKKNSTIHLKTGIFINENRHFVKELLLHRK